MPLVSRAARTHQRRLQQAVPGLEVLGQLMISRRGVDLLRPAAALQEHDLEKQQEQEEVMVRRYFMQ